MGAAHIAIALTSQETTTRKPKIAVIDDRPGRVNLALRVLAGARYRARAFTSPKDALDVVLTDHRMGEHNASELCDTLRARLGDAAPPIVLLTRSVHDLAIRDRELFAGILIKPLSPNALLSALKQALQQ